MASALHTGFGLLAFFAVRVRFAMGAFFVSERSLLLQQVAGDVDHLDGLALYRSNLRRVAAEAVVAVGDNPAFGPELAGGCTGEAVDFGFGDVGAAAVFIQLSGFALDGDALAIAASHRYAVNADVLPGSAGVADFSFRPLGPRPAFSDVPFTNVGSDFDGEVFEPYATRLLRVRLGCNCDCIFDDGWYVVAWHISFPDAAGRAW